MNNQFQKLIIIFGFALCSSALFAMELEPKVKKARTGEAPAQQAEGEEREFGPQPMEIEQEQPVALHAPQQARQPLDPIYRLLAQIHQELKQREAQNKAIPYDAVRLLAELQERAGTLYHDTTEPKFIAALNKIESEYQQKPEEHVIFVSSDKFSLAIPKTAALRSELVRNHLEIKPNETKFEFNHIPGIYLFHIIALLMKLDQLMLQNEVTDMPRIYIPSTFQEIVNPYIKQARATVELITELYNAALFLGVPYLLNAMARIVAQQIYTSLSAKKYYEDYQDADILQAAHAKKIFIPIDDLVYIKKFLKMFNYNIFKEYSIADYMREHGQPPIQDHVEKEINYDEYSLDNCIDLDNKKLTSLFGLHLIEHKEQVRDLLLNDNCFYGAQSDPQSRQITLQGFHNLTSLFIANSDLTFLPENFFTGSPQINMLHLEDNDLSNVPELLLRGLSRLEELDLRNNGIKRLLENQFISLAQLRWLHLHGNNITQLPERIFTTNTQLEAIGLGHNDLETVPEEIFQPVANTLQDLDLQYNKLQDLPQHVFRNLGNCAIDLRDNPLTPEDIENIRRYNPQALIESDNPQPEIGE